MTKTRTSARPPGRQSKSRMLIVLALLAGLLGVYSTNVGAVHDDGLFELDGNAINDGAVAGDDWDQVFQGSDNADVSRFVTDAVDNRGRDTTIFTTGGSKDDLDTPNWRHTAGSVPDKDELTHAYVARYGDNLYFGANRFITNGDAQIGFWFFQEVVGPVAGGLFGPGDHRDGDILVLSDFTKGGGTPTVRVFEWNGPGGDIPGQGAINGTLDLLAGTTADPQDCDTVADDDPFCATVNDGPGTSPSPWPYQAKSGPANVFPPGAFYEGGIDLGFLGLADECFSSFLAETRSSQSVDATLKDFVGGSFAQCQATMASEPSVGSGAEVTPGTPVSDTITITGSGVTNPPTPTGTVEFFLCGPIDSPAVCADDSNKVGETKDLTEVVAGTATAESDEVDTSLLAPGRYCFLIRWSGDDNYPGGPFDHAGTLDEECFYVATRPSATVTTPGSSTIVLGQSVTDTAVVTGDSVGDDPTGTVQFFICSPAQLTPADTGTCDDGDGVQVGTPAAGEDLVPDGNAATFTSSATSDAFTPTSPGRWCFRAAYSGNTVYDPSADFGSGAECFTVIDTSTVSTEQTWLPNDSATVLLSGGGAASGSVSFTLYASADCTGTVLRAAENVALDGNGQASSNNTDVFVNASATVSWDVVFTPSDPTTVQGDSHCETTTLSIDNINAANN